MKYGKGTVKKYSREYIRTLKNGKKKKYQTEQIQITVSKHDDIYKNDEEVIIIPTSSNENIEQILSSGISSENVNEDIDKLNRTIDEKNSIIREYKNQIKDLSNQSTASNHDSELIDKLKNEIADLKNVSPSNHENELIDKLKNEIADLKNVSPSSYDTELIDELKNEIADLKNEIEDIKSYDSYNQAIIRKYRRFILRTVNK